MYSLTECIPPALHFILVDITCLTVLSGKWKLWFDVCLTVHHWHKHCRRSTRRNNNNLLIFQSAQHVWGNFLPIIRSSRLCFTACGIMHPSCCRPVALEHGGTDYVFGVKDVARLSSSKILHTEHIVSASAFQRLCFTACGITHISCWRPVALERGGTDYVFGVKDDTRRYDGRATSFPPKTLSVPPRTRATCRQQIGCIIPHAVKHSLEFLWMGKNCPKHVELIGISINCYCCI